MWAKLKGIGVVWRLDWDWRRRILSVQMGWSLVLLASLLLNLCFFQATGITLRSDGILLSPLEKLSLNHFHSASDEWMIFFVSQIKVTCLERRGWHWERERERSPLIPFVCALQHFQMSVSLEQSRSKQLFEGRLGVTPDQTFKEVILFAESSKSYIHKACF